MAQALRLGEGDDGRTIELRVGEHANIDLYENASTGYRWVMDASDTNVASVQADAPSARPDAVGAGGRANWTITAVAPGTVQLRGKLWRHWEGEGSVKQRYAVTVRVRP
ncbi:MAG TPA: protease inhibitor I42 family protein [Burkholderiaceae bacterium]|nr:protease inhibitor I42 family protein [Burkholderiaceae bacterium]